MATIRSQMVLNDGVSDVLKKITAALDTTLNAFEQVQRASGQAIDASAISEARAQLVGVNGELSEMADRYRQVSGQVDRINQGLREQGSLADRATGELGSLLKTAGLGVAAKKLIGLSDDMTSTSARLSFLVDDDGSVEELEEKIMASAQRSRAAYLDTASAIASMGANAGAAFSSNDELIAFMEQVNRQFTIGGASAQGQAAAMLQLTQAMAAGALRGEELNSILENAPGIARAIEQYMGVAEGSIKQYAQEGEVTAEVVKNALFAVADETNAKFEAMPMTWSQVWTQMGNTALGAVQPLLNGVNWLANNLAIIGPVVLGLGSAFLVFQTAVHWTQIAEAAAGSYHLVVNLLTIGFGVLTGNTAAASAAVMEFNSALFASPATWAAMAMLVLVGVLYGVVAAYNRVTESSVSATGLICGSASVAAAVVANVAIGLFNGLIQAVWSIFVYPFLGVVEWVLNAANGGFDSFGGAVANLIGQIVGWFLALGKVVTTVIDAIFGTNWTAGLESLQSTVTSWGKNETAITLDRSAPVLDRVGYGEAWSIGNEFGKGVEAKVKGLFSSSSTGASYDFELGNLAGDVAQTAANTGVVADSLEVSTEELEYLRDIAERDAVNRFTTAEVKIDMTGMTNRIDSSMDLDGVIRELTEGFTEALVTSAEGVHT